MTRTKRIEYLIITLMMFVSTFILVACFGELEAAVSGENLGQERLMAGLLMGYMLTGVLSGILLAARFFSGRSLLFKAAAAALWFVTLFAVFVVGVFGLIPYELFNLIRIFAMPEEGV